MDYDGVIASRYVETSVVSVKQSFLRRIVSRGFNILVRFLFGLPFHPSIFRLFPLGQTFVRAEYTRFFDPVERSIRDAERGFPAWADKVMNGVSD